MARSVIEALQTKRRATPVGEVPSSPTAKKVPFDTATLSHIVPYVNGLKRKVKDALRETENLQSSPGRDGAPRSQGHIGGRQRVQFEAEEGFDEEDISEDWTVDEVSEATNGLQKIRISDR